MKIKKNRILKMKSTPYTFLVSFSLLPPFSYPHYLGPVSWRNLYLPGLFSDGGKKSTIAISTYQLVQLLSRVQLFATPWTVAYEAPPSTRFSRQEYWSWLPLPSPEDLPNPGTEPESPAMQADTLPSELPRKLPRKLDYTIT